ncbi:MAG: polysaccharide deacetylase family protein [Clostridia bacterium]|nr:polysaccharide deacetylase family protein [Clostridia bacterium]MBQ9786113.1 polysaccharide deacetylase family protein [Clostridia bacterium]
MDKTKLKKILAPISVNLVIFAMLASLFTLTINNDVKSVFSPQSEDLYYKGNTEQKNVTLMINVYWGNEYLPNMLKTLEDNNVKTTFFVGGTWVNKFPELFLQIVEDGHEIGNHGYFHKDHDKLNYAQNSTEIMATHKLVREYTSKNMNLFAPPSGAYSDITLKVASNLGYKTIMFSKDTIDWRDHDTNLIIKRATTKIENGDLILMHPTLNTAEALPSIIKSLKEQGFNLVTVSENIGII